MHTFGPDTLIFEVQQTSNLAQTVMPDDLYGNPLPVETWEANIHAALDELRTDYQPRPNAGLTYREGVNRYTFGCAGTHFALERWTLTESHDEPNHPRRCLTLSNVGDVVQIEYAGGTEILGRGESCLLPAAIGQVRIVPKSTAELIVCYVPDLERDVVAPLRDAGYTDLEINTLGEVAMN